MQMAACGFVSICTCTWECRLCRRCRPCSSCCRTSVDVSWPCRRETSCSLRYSVLLLLLAAGGALATPSPTWMLSPAECWRHPPATILAIRLRLSVQNPQPVQSPCCWLTVCTRMFASVDGVCEHAHTLSLMSETKYSFTFRYTQHKKYTHTYTYTYTKPI